MPDFPLFGNYIPGTSPLHRMDPRAKLLLALGLILVVFVARTFVALGMCALFAAVLVGLSGIRPTAVLRSIVPLLFIVVVTALINLFFIQGGDVIASLGPATISERGLYSCAFFSVRLTLLLLCMSLLTLTTTNLDITEGFEALLKRFKRFGVPAHELGMMMGIALRFLPQFVFEAQTVYRAQISRGAEFAGGVGKGRLRSLSSLIVPLFTSAFRHAETLSCAMEARCYHGDAGRTRLSPLAYSALDAYGALALAIMLACVIAANLIPW